MYIKLSNFIWGGQLIEIYITRFTFSCCNFPFKCWQECWDKGTLLHCWWECRLVQALWKAVWRELKKLKMDLLFDPAIPLLGIYLKESKTLIQKNISTLLVIAALFTIAKISKQPQCPSVDELIKQHNGILLSHKKEENFTLCNSLDGLGEHYAKWNVGGL